MSYRTPLRLLIAGGGLALALWVFPGYRRGGFKGSLLPLESAIRCVAVSAVVALAVGGLWHQFPAPFVAGIAGVFTTGGGHLIGPYAGVFGLGVGLVVASLLPARPPRVADIVFLDKGEALDA